MKATVFVITASIGSEYDITAEQAKEMSDSGLVEIESHTVNHNELAQLGSEEQAVGASAVSAGYCPDHRQHSLMCCPIPTAATTTPPLSWPRNTTTLQSLPMAENGSRTAGITPFPDFMPQDPPRWTPSAAPCKKYGGADVLFLSDCVEGIDNCLEQCYDNVHNIFTKPT